MMGKRMRMTNGRGQESYVNPKEEPSEVCRGISLCYWDDLHSRDAVCFSPGERRKSRAGHVACGIHDSWRTRVERLGAIR